MDKATNSVLRFGVKLSFTAILVVFIFYYKDFMATMLCLVGAILIWIVPEIPFVKKLFAKQNN